MFSSRSATVCAAIVFSVNLLACQIAEKEAPSKGVLSARPTVDGLARATAEDRKRRISNLEYELFVDIHSSTDAYRGESTIRFDLSDAQRDLTVDFEGHVILNLPGSDSGKAPLQVHFFGISSNPMMAMLVITAEGPPPGLGRVGQERFRLPVLPLTDVGHGQRAGALLFDHVLDDALVGVEEGDRAQSQPLHHQADLLAAMSGDA